MMKKQDMNRLIRLRASYAWAAHFASSETDRKLAAKERDKLNKRIEKLERKVK